MWEREGDIVVKELVDIEWCFGCKRETVEEEIV